MSSPPKPHPGSFESMESASRGEPLTPLPTAVLPCSQAAQRPVVKVKIREAPASLLVLKPKPAFAESLVLHAVEESPPGGQFEWRVSKGGVFKPVSTHDRDLLLTPVATGEVPIDLVYRTSDGEASATITVKVVGIPRIEVSDISHFGRVRVGAASTAQRFTISNPGTAPLIIRSCNVVGDNEDCFENPLGNPPNLAIPAGDSVRLSMSFQPVGKFGRKEAFLIIQSNAENLPTANVLLAGTATRKELDTSFKGHRFADILLALANQKKYGAAVEFDLVNGGNEPTRVQTIVPPPGFALIKPLDSFYVGPGTPVTVAIEFRPESAGVVNEQLQIGSDAENNPSLIFPLSGECIPPKEIEAKAKSKNDGWYCAQDTKRCRPAAVHISAEERPRNSGYAGKAIVSIDGSLDSVFADDKCEKPLCEVAMPGFRGGRVVYISPTAAASGLVKLDFLECTDPRFVLLGPASALFEIKAVNVITPHIEVVSGDGWFDTELKTAPILPAVKLSAKPSFPDRAYTATATVSCSAGTLHVAADGTGPSITSLKHAELKAGKQLYVKPTKTGTIKVTLKLAQGNDPGIYAEKDEEVDLIIKPVNIVTPKIDVEYKVVLVDKDLKRHQKGGEVHLRSEPTYIEVSIEQSEDEPNYDKGGKLVLSQPKADVFSDATCATKAAAKICNADLTADPDPTKLYLRGKTQGQFTVKIDLDAPDTKTIRVKPMTPVKMAAIKLNATLHKLDPADTSQPLVAMAEKDKVQPGGRPQVQDNAGTGYKRLKLAIDKPHADFWDVGESTYEIVVNLTITSGSVSLFRHETNGARNAGVNKVTLHKADFTGTTLDVWIQGLTATAAKRDIVVDIGMDRLVGGRAKTAKRRGDWSRLTVVTPVQCYESIWPNPAVAFVRCPHEPPPNTNMQRPHAPGGVATAAPTNRYHHHGGRCDPCSSPEVAAFHWLDCDLAGNQAAQQVMTLRNQMAHLAGLVNTAVVNFGILPAAAAGHVAAGVPIVAYTGPRPWLVGLEAACYLMYYGQYIAPTLPRRFKPKMIGVLLAHLGATNYKLRGVSGQLPGTGASPHLVNAYWSRPLNPTHVIHSYSQNSKTYHEPASMPPVARGGTFGSCAASAMLSHALHLGLEIDSMAEIWVGHNQGARRDGQLQASCDNCRDYIGELLCESGGNAPSDPFPLGAAAPTNNGF